MQAITTQKQELKFYKRLVENNLQEDLSIDEIRQIQQAKKNTNSK